MACKIREIADHRQQQPQHRSSSLTTATQGGLNDQETRHRNTHTARQKRTDAAKSSKGMIGSMVGMVNQFKNKISAQLVKSDSASVAIDAAQRLSNTGRNRSLITGQMANVRSSISTTQGEGVRKRTSSTMTSSSCTTEDHLGGSCDRPSSEVKRLRVDVSNLEVENKRLYAEQLTRETEIRAEVSKEMEACSSMLLEQIQELQEQLMDQATSSEQICDVTKSVKKIRKQQRLLQQEESAEDLEEAEEEIERLKTAHEKEISEYKLEKDSLLQQLAELKDKLEDAEKRAMQAEAKMQAVKQSTVSCTSECTQTDLDEAIPEGPSRESIEYEVAQSKPFGQNMNSKSGETLTSSGASNAVALAPFAPIDLKGLSQPQAQAPAQAQAPLDTAKEFSTRMKRDSRFRNSSTEGTSRTSKENSHNDGSKQRKRESKRGKKSVEICIETDKQDPPKPRHAVSPARSRSPLLVLRSDGNSPIRLQSLDAVKPRILPSPCPKSVNAKQGNYAVKHGKVGKRKGSSAVNPIVELNDENSPVGKLRVEEPIDRRPISNHPYMKRLRSYRAL